jgi:UDP-N-acetyl-alpha-D-muramoyl-L-alanyl-L-glutamate epimerase
MTDAPNRARAEVFTYVGLEVGRDTLRGRYRLDERPFEETVAFDGTGRLDRPEVVAVAELWYLLAGLSYLKAGAARRVDLGAAPLGDGARRLLRAAIVDGLGEFAYRHGLDLADVALEGGCPATWAAPALDAEGVLVPFGGGIDSLVTLSHLSRDLDRALFVVSPSTGRFAPLEATAALTGLEVVRATRTLDPQLTSDPDLWQGHVPVTAMVTALGAVAAVASGRGGVAMSNERSASAPNLRVGDREVNHQWSKSLAAEDLLAAAIAERVGPSLTVASVLRDRSEIWVAQEFSRLDRYLPVFRSCNRAFAHRVDERLAGWCGECDKCLFVNLVLAPFVERARLRSIFGHEPLSDPGREAQLRVLVGLGATPKPFECVGDPDESAAALVETASLDEWRDVEMVTRLAHECVARYSLAELLEPQGVTRVPARWLR